MDILALIPGLKKVSTSPAKGPEYHGLCPVCGGTGKESHRFVCWPQQGVMGTWWCRGCGKGGDAIAWLRHGERLSYLEACARLGIEPATTQRPATSSPRSTAMVKERQERPYTPERLTMPPAEWRAKAEAFAAYCHQALLANPGQLSWLLSRGIGIDMVTKYRLGWNATDLWRQRQSWGLPVETKEDGKERKLWLPWGLVIPWTMEGQISFIQIRRPQGEPKYYCLPGCSNRQPLITRKASIYLVVESRLDAILLDGLAGDLAGFIAMGSASIKPDTEANYLLRHAAFIGCALDADPQGEKDAPWWPKEFRQARRTCPGPGKDPGAMFEAGCDLRSWILAQLPAGLAHGLAAANHAAPAPEPVPVPDEPATPEPPISLPAGTVVIDLEDGREVYVTADPAAWSEMAGQGLLCFSENEMIRTREAMDACGGLGSELLERVLLVKEIFPGAYVRRGGAAREILS